MMGTPQGGLEEPPPAAHPAVVQCPGRDLQGMEGQGGSLVPGATYDLVLVTCHLLQGMPPYPPLFSGKVFG